MNPIWAFIKTTRPVNLLIIAATMVFMRYFIEGSYVKLLIHRGLISDSSRISNFHFSLLTLVMVFLAASGNLINDYFDVKVDRINKPYRITIGKTLKRRVAMAAHHGLNSMAVLLGIYLGWVEKTWFYAFTPLIIASSLWFYSFYLKKTFLLGNILVALVVSVVPIWTCYELLTLPITTPNSLIISMHLFFAAIIIGYTIQAYIISLLREIVKDAEDVEGDKEFGYRTMPIVWGWTKTRIALLTGQLIWLLVLIKIAYSLSVEYTLLSAAAFGILVILPFIMAILCIRKSEIKKAHFTRASFWLKMTLGGGLIFSLFIPELMKLFLDRLF